MILTRYMWVILLLFTVYRSPPLLMRWPLLIIVNFFTIKYTNWYFMKRNILLITVIAAAMMELIDTSIVNVALSQMSGNLGATLEDTSWVVTSYAIANVIIIPITSFLAAKL